MPRVERVTLAYNNVYVLEAEGEAVVVDTGPDFRGAREALAAHLGSREPAMVIATHGHFDHAGLGRWWQSQGTPVALGVGDVNLARRTHFSQPGEFESFLRYIEDSGAPQRVQAELFSGLEARREWARSAATRPGYPPARPTDRWPTGLRFDPFEPDVQLAGETALPAGATAVSCPGHTPGNLVLVVESHGWLFSGDQLLPDITPTPGIQFVRDESSEWRRFASLPPFVDALRRLRAMSFERCFPGHGEPFDNVADVIEANLAQVEQRTERVLDALRDAGPVRLHELAERLYPRALRRRWWQIIATIQGHLDLLASEGRARMDDDRWAPVS